MSSRMDWVTDDEVVTMLHLALKASEQNGGDGVDVPRGLLWLAKRSIERLSHQVAVLQTEAAMEKGNV